jgi:hypothetical protein
MEEKTLQETLNDPILNEIAEMVIMFCSKLSGKTYYPYQEIIGKNILKHVIAQTGEDISVLLSRQSGKSVINGEMTAGAMVILPELAKVYKKEYPPVARFETNYKGAGTGGLRAGVFAPIDKQAHVVFNIVRTILESDNAKEILKELNITLEVSRGDTVSLSNNSRISCNSASEGANIKSATHDLIILDEAQDMVSRVIVDSIRPMRINTGGNVVYVGTCGNYKWDFYDTIQVNKNLEQEDGIQRHFQFDYNHCSACNPQYKRAVDKDIAKYGWESDEVKLNYRLIWLLERGSIVTDDMMYGTGYWAGRGMLDEEAEIEEINRRDHCFAGLDMGKENDSTVLTIVKVDKTNPIYTPDGTYYIKRILNWLEIQGDNYESQYWQIVEFLRRYSVDRLCIDATQHDPVADRMSTYLTNIDVEPIKATEQQNSEMFKLAQQEIQAGRIKVPYGPRSREHTSVKKFIHQHLELEKEYKGQILKAKHPDKRGAHDDYWSSHCLSVWATRDVTLPGVECHTIDIFGRNRGLREGHGMLNQYHHVANFPVNPKASSFHNLPEIIQMG